MKAVSAQCPTVGNQKNTMKKKKPYSHSTQKPQLTPQVWHLDLQYLSVY